MFLSLVVSILAIFAVLLSLINLFTTACYTARTPSGSDAMGLIVPFILSAIGGIALLIATWVGVARGWFDWISSTPLIPFVATTAISVGVCFLAVALLAAWAERAGRWIVPAGAIGGGLGPVALASIIIASAWTPADPMAAASLSWIAGGFLAAVALVGYGLGLFALSMHLKMKRGNQARALAEHYAREAEWDRKRKRTPMEVLREDFSEMSDTAPLWVFAGYLAMAHSDDCRAFIIERMLKVGDLEGELARTIISQYACYRHGCIEMMRLAHQLPVKPAWAGLLTQAVERTVAEMAADPQWLTKIDVKSNPAEHLAAIAGAAARLEAASMTTPELRAALARLEPGRALKSPV